MIITIGRQHGTNGHNIAVLLSQELHIPCYSKEILDRAAEDSNFSREILKSYDEKRVSAFVAPSPHYFGMDEGFRLNMQVASAQFDAIRTLADEGDAIFVGRCADYILRQRRDLVRVFIMADLPFRIKTLMARKNIGEEEAKKLIKEVDKDRSSYYRYYTDQIWGEAENYDLCLNSGRISFEGAAQVIRSYIEGLI